MKKRICIALIVVLLLALASCSDPDNAAKHDATTRPGTEMHTIVDCIGRQVTLPKTINRIATTFSPAGHVTVMLGHGADIVATSNGLQRDKLLFVICPEIQNASVVKVAGDFNIEELMALRVDVVFLSYDMYLDKKSIKKLDEFNLPFVVVDFKSMAEQKQMVNVIADVLGEAEEAAVYDRFYDQVIAQVSSALSVLPASEKILVYHSINEAVTTVGADTLPEDWMKVAGGIDVSLEGELKKEDDKFYTTIEQILAWNPEIILCNVEGTDVYIRTQPAWQNIKAVKDNRVYLMPVGLSRWGHTTSTETPLAIAWTAKTLYPQYCGTIDLKALMRTFYHDLFEYDVTDLQIEQILNGQGMRLSKELE